MTDRVIIDTQVYDAVVKDENLKWLIELCQTAGQITLVSTHVESDEVNRIPTHLNIGQGTALETEQIPTGMVAFDHSQFDQSRFGTQAADAVFQTLQIKNPRHTNDAVIGATALTDADILVTDDGPFRKRFSKLHTRVQVMSSTVFTAYLAQEVASLGPAKRRLAVLKLWCRKILRAIRADHSRHFDDGTSEESHD
jgi:hypothetical protein